MAVVSDVGRRTFDVERAKKIWAAAKFREDDFGSCHFEFPNPRHELKLVLEVKGDFAGNWITLKMLRWQENQLLTDQLKQKPLFSLSFFRIESVYYDDQAGMIGFCIRTREWEDWKMTESVEIFSDGYFTVSSQ